MIIPSLTPQEVGFFLALAIVVSIGWFWLRAWVSRSVAAWEEEDEDEDEEP